MSESQKDPECIQSCKRFSKKASKKAKDMTCPELLEKMNELSFREKRGWESGAKGLEPRLRDYKGDDTTHITNIENDQRSLRTYMREYAEKGCGDPPPRIQELSEVKLPDQQSVQNPDAQEQIVKGTAIVVGGAGVGYIIYRAIRFLPSLIPAAWPTIPANLAIP